MIALAPSLSEVQTHLIEITKSHNVVYVGHNVTIDLKVLKLSDCQFIDTQDFYPGVVPKKLALLSERELNARIQEGTHSSVIDCRAALGIFLANNRDTANLRFLSHDYLLDKKALKSTIKANQQYLRDKLEQKENLAPVMNSKKLIKSICSSTTEVFLSNIKDDAIYRVDVKEVRQLIQKNVK